MQQDLDWLNIVKYLQRTQDVSSQLMRSMIDAVRSVSEHKMIKLIKIFNIFCQLSSQGKDTMF